MDDLNEVSGRSSARRGVDLWLNAGIGVLVIAVIGLGGWFGYSVFQDREAGKLTNAPTRVVEALKTQVRKSPNDVVLRVRLGEALGAARQFDDSVEQFNQALRIDPKHVGAYLDLGLVSLLTKNDDKAERYFNKVLELTDKAEYSAIDERRETALYQLGLLKLRQKEYEDAAGYFKAALRIRKDASDTYVALADALDGMGDQDGALATLEVALQFDPNYAEAHYREGLIYQKRKDDVNASYHFYRAYKVAPDVPETQDAIQGFGEPSDWVAKSAASQKAGDLAKALEQIRVATNLDPESVDIQKKHAELLDLTGEYGNALDVYIGARTRAPKDKQIAAQIARLEKEHPAEALKTYQARLKANSSDKELKAKVAELKKVVGAK